MTPIVNSTDIKQLCESGEVFRKIQILYGQPPNWSRPQGFVTLCKIILEQQVSLQSANAHFLKLSDYLPSFSPEEILNLTDVEMRQCQISRQKAGYLRSLSQAVKEGLIDFENMALLPQATLREQLSSIKGIGNWTADVYLMFCLQAKDIFPIGDVAVLKTIRELTIAQTKDDILALAKNWSPCRSLATYFLWHYYLKKRNREVSI